MSDIIGSAFEIRNASDYDDMYIATVAEAKEQLAKTNQFLCVISGYIKTKTHLK